MRTTFHPFSPSRLIVHACDCVWSSELQWRSPAAVGSGCQDTCDAKRGHTTHCSDCLFTFCPRNVCWSASAYSQLPANFYSKPLCQAVFPGPKCLFERFFSIYFSLHLLFFSIGMRHILRKIKIGRHWVTEIWYFTYHIHCHLSKLMHLLLMKISYMYIGEHK